jgi:hypothetical protein
MLDTNQIRQNAARSMLILRTLGDEDNPYSVDESLNTVVGLLDEIYSMATTEPKD